MKQMFRYLTLIVFITFSGCTIPVLDVYGRVEGKKIEPETVSLIYPKKTTKQELFSLFGIPTAIAIRSKPLYLINPFVADGRKIENKLQLQSEPFFELFREHHSLQDIHRVYFYTYTQSRETFVLFYSEFFLKADRLWVLVNEETELVEGVYYMPYDSDNENLQ